MNINDRELLARTLQAEAGNQGYDGMLAAGSVIMNRANATGYGDGMRGVILKPGQFSAWNSSTGYAGGEQGQDMANMRASGEAYKAADAIISGTYDDATGGATHYYNPAISQPKWGQKAGGDWNRIGDHVFGFADAGKKPNPNQAIASDTMKALGSLPDAVGLLGASQAPNNTESKMIPEEKPRGLLGSLGIQKMVEGAEGEAGQRFTQRDTFKDTAARLAQGFAAMGSNPALQKMTAGIAAERTETKARNKSMEVLAGLPNGEELVRIAEAFGPQAAIKFHLESQKPPKDNRTDDLKEYGAAKDQGYQGTFIEYQAEAAGSKSGSVFSDKVSTYRDAYPDASDAEILEMIKDPAKIPAAYQSLVLRAKDAGLVPGTPEYQDFMQTGGAGDATFAKEEAKVRSAALESLPLDIESSKQALDVLDLALSDEYRVGLNKFVGPLDAYIPNMSGAAKGFRAVHDQIKGKTFMEAYKTLKGGGQITEVEGIKATKAFARLERSQTEEDYIQALNDLRDVIHKQYMRSQSKLRGFQGGESASKWEVVE
tara:strand:+ start:944 stop:2572 length:1629 start_codon:yes stop_codon:yes gene_type:complete